MEKTDQEKVEHKSEIVEELTRYDARRKELTHIIKEKKEMKKGGRPLIKVELTSRGIYSEEGIKKIYREQKDKRTNLERQIKQLKENINEVEVSEEEQKELDELKEKLMKLQRLDNIEKQREQLIHHHEELKEVNKRINAISSAIGDRLKLNKK